MNRITLGRILAAFAVAAIAIAPAAAQEKKKEVRTVVVKDGQVITVDGARPRRFVRGFLGIQSVGLTPELREHFRVAKDAGVLVSHVVADSPAAKAGIRVGDIITGVDGTRVDSPGDLTRAVRDKKKGEALRIDYVRDGANATAIATVVERERQVVDLRDLDIQIPDIQIPDIPEIPNIGKNLERYFNSPEWKAQMHQLQNLPDCGDMQRRMRDLELKMKDLQKRLGQK